MSFDDVSLADAHDQARLIRERTLSSRELLGHLLERVEAINGDLNAIIAFDLERAWEAADRADRALANGDDLPALHGLPITVKDAIATEGITTTGGAAELADNVPTVDAPVVERVRSHGAFVFGKSNLPRWSGDIQAYNDLFGTTSNPWDLDRGPGGSSGGAAAAVAAGLTSFEIGTDIGGSVRLPAHFSGVCGHKPSFGIVPQRGYVSHPTGGSTDADVNVFGPIARSVDDLELLLGVLAGPLTTDSVAWKLELPQPRHDDIGDFRVAAWLDDPSCPVSTGVAALLDNAVSTLERHGARIDRGARPGIDLSEFWDVGSTLIGAATSPSRTEREFSRQVAIAEDESRDRLDRTRAESSVLRHRDWLLLDETRQEHRDRWAGFFEHHDVLLCPVAMTEAFPHTQEGDLYSRSITVDGAERPYLDLIQWTGFIGYAYLPATVVPVGLTADGLPVGIQVVAPYLEDRTALAFARIVERLLGGYQPPPIAQLS